LWLRAWHCQNGSDRCEQYRESFDRKRHG
jgi:hypothetical protein